MKMKDNHYNTLSLSFIWECGRQGQINIIQTFGISYSIKLRCKSSSNEIQIRIHCADEALVGAYKRLVEDYS